MAKIDKFQRLKKHLPDHLAARFESAINDEQMLSIESDAALIEVWKTELMERLDTGESTKIWQRLADAWSQFEEGTTIQRQGRETGDENMRAQGAAMSSNAITEIGRLIRQGAKIEETWKDLMNAVNNSVAVKRAEHARRRDMQQMVHAEEILYLVRALINVIDETIEDRVLRETVSTRLATVVAESRRDFDDAMKLADARRAEQAQSEYGEFL